MRVNHSEIRCSPVTILAAVSVFLLLNHSNPAAAGRIELVYWNWAPGIDQIVEIWNKKHPDVHVTVSRAAGARQIVPKLIAADRAGNPPDVTNVTYQDLPALVVNGLVANITPEAAPLREKIAPVAWTLVNFGGSTWAMPQGTSPMMLYYRQDLFEEYGLRVPATWDEFASLAKQIRSTDSKRYLTNFSTSDPGLFVALAHQAGAKWWELSGDVWIVDIAGPPSRQIAEYWEKLVAADAVVTSQSWTPEWNAAIANGNLLLFISAVWAPPLIGNMAPETRGKWNVAPLPRWNSGPGASWAGGVMGGSATAVSPKSKHPVEAREFAIWITNDPEALGAYVRLANIWPARLEARDLDVLKHAPAFIPQRQDFYELATQVDQATPQVSWGPNVSLAFDAFKNAFGPAVRNRAGFVEALQRVQRTVVHDLRSQGYEVKEGR